MHKVKTKKNIQQALAVVVLIAFALFAFGPVVCVKASEASVSEDYPYCCVILIEEGCSPCCEVDLESCCFPSFYVPLLENATCIRNYIINVTYTEPFFCNAICSSIFRPPEA